MSDKREAVVETLDSQIESMMAGLTRYCDSTNPVREEGKDWPQEPEALSMIGMKRMRNIRECVEEVIQNNVPGDLMECGVWRGGAAILMRALLKARGVTNRKVWVCDSFEGIPPQKDRTCVEDKGVVFGPDEYLSVGLETVKANFKEYGLLDEQVVFVPGWFKDTLYGLVDELEPGDKRKGQGVRLAVLRLDGDLYESTIDCLSAMYSRVSAGGYVIIDDYALSTCRKAVDDFRAYHGVTEEMKQIDWTGVYWKKETLAVDVAGGGK